MDRPVTPAHELVNPGSLAPPSGFSHAVAAARGRTVYLGGQTGHDRAGKIESSSIVDQFARAAANVVTALEAAGAAPDDLVAMTIYVTDVEEYRGALSELGAAYRKHFGRHYPAIALLGVSALFDPAAKVELVCTAVVPEVSDTARGR
jgi:enamine deaminase RidA (YjgF/YER057c/UK114 family)